jgi:hypothetical protein
MSSPPLTDPQPAADPTDLARLRVEQPTIKILLYTDDPDDIPRTSGKDLGLGRMIEHLLAHAPASARLDPKWVSRSSSNRVHADNKLDDVLRKELEQTGQPFDEIWFFGLHQANKERVSFGAFRGGPESELTESEVVALRKWMEVEGEGAVGGGVLMAGDHGHPRPEDTSPGTNPLCPDSSAGQEFLGRGRAIGRCVPRAGQLRRWEGAPTNREEDRFNTVEPRGAQSDKFPQKLILRNLDAAGDPDPDGQPHPIFAYRPGVWIDVFPDHIHEGTVVLPENFDPDVWRGQVRPHVVAYGIDKRNSKLLDLVMTYNGDLVGVGRIVADASWHHYFNINLRNFRLPADEGSNADKIGQFYGNLAAWLCPRRKRREMACAMLWRLATYTMLMEEPGKVMNIGREAYGILSQVAPPCEINEMIQAFMPGQFGALAFPTRGLTLSHLPSQELLLGYVLNEYHQEMIRAESSDGPYEPRGVDRVIDSGVVSAFTKQAELLGMEAAKTLNMLGLQPL